MCAHSYNDNGECKRRNEGAIIFGHVVKNKLLVYKAILKPIWTYGVQLWGSASNSHIEILERSQSKLLRIITDTPWYVPNA
jgi:hypothetical protein